MGLTVRSGNTEQVEYNAQAHLQRRTPATRLSFDYIGNVSSLDGVENANNHRVNSEFDLWLSQRLYLLVPFAEYYQDPFQNLARRVTVGVGVGYDLVARPNLEWNITAGPAFQQAWFESSLPGEPTEKGVAALVFGSRFDWEITRRIDLILEYRGQYTSRGVGETAHHFVEEGWQFGGPADAAAKYQDTGISAEQNVKGTVSFREGTVSGGSSTDMRAGTEKSDATGAALATRGGMEVYQFTESGIALQATVAGTKYWQDSKLNK